MVFLFATALSSRLGQPAELPQAADEILDLTGHIVLPGLINTHHHFYQTLTRAVPAAQDANLFNWLKTLYPIWARMRPEDIRISTQTALAELALSGCTTASDHLYLFPNGSRLDDEIQAAREVGLRLHASRWLDEPGREQGWLPPDSVVEDEDFILKDFAAPDRDLSRPKSRRHDPDRAGAMLALQRDRRSDAPERLAGARIWRAPAHPPGRDPGRRELSACRNLATARWPIWSC